MLERGQQAAVAGRDVSPGGGEEVEVALDPAGHIGAGKHAHPGSGQLDSQRQTSRQPAQVSQVGGILGAQGEAQVVTSRTLEEQTAGAASLDGRRVFTLWYLQASDLEQPLAPDVEALARGDDEPDPGCVFEDLGDERHPSEQVLEAVQNQEEFAVSQVVQKLLVGAGGAVEGESQCIRNGGGEELR